FAQFADVYKKMYEWLRSTARPDGPGKHPLWVAEPWRGTDAPEAWLNAVSVMFLTNYRDLLREVCASRLVAELGASTQKPDITWPDVIDYASIKATIEAHVIEPIRTGKANNAAMILYGPTGTSKTS